jgi:hypothetical protein
MTEEQRKEIMRLNPPEISWIHGGDAYFSWCWAACGFGQLSFSFDREKNVIQCSNECMGRDYVRTLLHAFADFVADHAVLDDYNELSPPKPMPAAEEDDGVQT